MKKIPHLKMLKMIMLLTGLWPFQNRNIKVLRIYNIYSNVFWLFFVANMVSIWANIPFSLHSQDALIENLSFSISYSLVLVTVSFTKNETVKMIIQQILEKEQHIVRNSNEEVKHIYYRYTNYNRKISIFLGCSLCILLAGLYVAWIISIVTGIKDSCLFPIYLPFQVHKYFWVCWVYSTMQLVVVGLLYFYTKLLFMSLIIFGVSSMKMLQHFLKYFENYSKTHSLNQNMSPEESKYTVLRWCIKEHNNIIGFVNDVKKATSKYMLINFLATSIELCAVLLRLMVIQNKEDYPPTLLLLAMHLSHLTILYWNADLIRAESLKLGDYVFLYTGWQNQNKNFRVLTQMMMLRSQHHLSLAIGPFGEMSNLTLVNIIKAAFSYLTFFRTVYEK